MAFMCMHELHTRKKLCNCRSSSCRVVFENLQQLAQQDAELSAPDKPEVQPARFEKWLTDITMLNKIEHAGVMEWISRRRFTQNCRRHTHARQASTGRVCHNMRRLSVRPCRLKRCGTASKGCFFQAWGAERVRFSSFVQNARCEGPCRSFVFLCLFLQSMFYPGKISLLSAQLSLQSVSTFIWKFALQSIFSSGGGSFWVSTRKNLFCHPLAMFLFVFPCSAVVWSAGSPGEVLVGAFWVLSCALECYE